MFERLQKTGFFGSEPTGERRTDSDNEGRSYWTFFNDGIGFGNTTVRLSNLSYNLKSDMLRVYSLMGTLFNVVSLANGGSIHFWDESRSTDYEYVYTNKYTNIDAPFDDIGSQIKAGLCGADANYTNVELSADFVEIGRWKGSPHQDSALLYRGDGGTGNSTMESCLSKVLTQANNDYIKTILAQGGQGGGGIGFPLIITLTSIGAIMLLGSAFASSNGSNTGCCNRSRQENRDIEMDSLEEVVVPDDDGRERQDSSTTERKQSNSSELESDEDSSSSLRI